MSEKFLVLKWEDIRFLEEYEDDPGHGADCARYLMESIQDMRKAEGKKPVNEYWVVNKDEPYAEKVEALIFPPDKT